MLIKDFTDNNIRLGEFPACIDVKNIPRSHSNDGVLCSVYSLEYLDTTKSSVLFIQNVENSFVYHLVVMSSEEQFNQLPDEIKNGEVLFSSDQTFIERLKTI